jgi:hypothetical protein
MSALAAKLAETDPDLAEALVNAQPNATRREEAFATHSILRTAHNAEAHLEWAESQIDPERRDVALNQGLRMKTAEHCRNYCRHPLLGSGADRIISFPRKAGRFTVKLQQIVHYNSRA